MEPYETKWTDHDQSLSSFCLFSKTQPEKCAKMWANCGYRYPAIASGSPKGVMEKDFIVYGKLVF